MRIPDAAWWLVIPLALMVASGAMTGLAALGEPQSAWLICEVIGMEVCR